MLKEGEVTQDEDIVSSNLREPWGSAKNRFREDVRGLTGGRKVSARFDVPVTKKKKKVGGEASRSAEKWGGRVIASRIEDVLGGLHGGTELPFGLVGGKTESAWLMLVRVLALGTNREAVWAERGFRGRGRMRAGKAPRPYASRGGGRKNGLFLGGKDKLMRWGAWL